MSRYTPPGSYVQSFPGYNHGHYLRAASDPVRQVVHLVRCRGTTTSTSLCEELIVCMCSGCESGRASGDALFTREARWAQREAVTCLQCLVLEGRVPP